MDTGLRKRFINSNEEEKMMAHIYIAFVDTPGFFAALIRKFLKQRYVHVVIAADAMLTEAYSVGRRAPAIPFFSGFEREDKNKILHTFPTAFYRICELSCTAQQKQEIMERLHTDWRKRFHIHYAVIGLPFIVMGIPFYLKNQYTCSSYIARLLQEKGICVSEKHFSLVTPKDFLRYKKMRVIFEGELSEIISECPQCVLESVFAYE